MHNIRLFVLFWFFGLLLGNQFSFSIKPRTSQTPPFCHECKFYKPLSYGKYDNFGKCSLYIKVYDDMLQYEYADVARQNKKKCGENGTDFQPKPKSK
jgi:hypothetical protein